MKKFLSAVLLLGSLLYAVSTENILALSWQNSYCKVHPNNKACLMRKNGDYSLSHFVLHGLWPKKRNFCHTKYKFDLSPLLKRVVKKYMPSLSLAKHEWKKHGSCFGSDVETYFLTAIKLTQEFNESPFLRFVRMHMDEHVSLARIRFVFAGAFGKNNVRKFQLVCEKKDGVVYITEIRLNLKGDPTKEDLKELLDNANEMIGVKQCQGGIFSSP